ncbi:MAG: type I-B CRISPR-associated protein Cas5b [Thermoplasmata archaeon]|nr:type I-B CRISPR-associated protein Cas5b [Thermoplasmata archaeon]
MPTEFLFMEFFQPFAQYRNPFTFYYAQTYPLPPKSTIIGMLQSALGDWYGSNLGTDRWWNLKVSVHGGFESVFWNYQSLIKGTVELKGAKLMNQGLPLYGGGITSQRTPVHQQELFNGHLYIFIKGDSQLLDDIKEAIEHPKKVLCLGRSEDVVFLRNCEFTQASKKNKVKKSLWLTYPTYLLKEHLPIQNQKYPVFSVPVKVLFKNGNENVTSKAEITKNTKREVVFNTVVFTGTDYVVYLNNREIDVEVFDIKGKNFKIPTKAGWL